MIIKLLGGYTKAEYNKLLEEYRILKEINERLILGGCIKHNEDQIVKVSKMSFTNSKKLKGKVK